MKYIFYFFIPFFCFKLDGMGEPPTVQGKIGDLIEEYTGEQYKSYLEILPADVQKIIVTFVASGLSYDQSLKEVKNLRLLNRRMRSLIDNNIGFFIIALAQNFFRNVGMPNLTKVATDLGTPTALRWLNQSGNIEFIFLILEKLKPVTILDYGTKVVLGLIANNPLLANARNVDNATPLHIAALKGLDLIAQALVKAKADVNARDKEGNTPLLLAIANGHPTIAKFLIENRAIDLPNNLNQYAEDSRNTKIQQLKTHPSSENDLLLKQYKDLPSHFRKI